VDLMTDRKADHDVREGPTLTWLARNSFTAAVWTAVVAFVAPLVALAAVSHMLRWQLSHKPSDWAAWIPAIATTWAATVAAGYFVITAALFHMTARQAEAAATQATAAAAAAERSASESRVAADALRGTVERQRLERRREWEPLRSALETTYAALARIATQATIDRTGGFLRTARPVPSWWNEHVREQWSKAEWLLPDARDEFRAAQAELEALDRTFDDLLREVPRPTQLQQALPGVAEMAEQLARRLALLSARVDHASGLGDASATSKETMEVRTNAPC
jgi:hypothetical protein